MNPLAANGAITPNKKNARGAAKAVVENQQEEAEYFLGIMTQLDSVIFPGGACRVGRSVSPIPG